ncbi:MAG: hypothetical protein ABR53_00100 [Nitrosopumilus sp. BACL13 MAG-121220-bin23]|nr:MAG: hypothetical protein ABR53_00100 [Nitrosopumilus sp. BACL13 MAG-121220-bin23]
MAQTDEDFQLILKTFEISKKTILDEIKKLQYNLRTETRSRSRSGSYKLTIRAKDLFKHVQAEIDRAMIVMVELRNQELLELIPHTTVNRRLQSIQKIMNTIFHGLDKFDDQEIIQEHFQFHIEKMNAVLEDES